MAWSALRPAILAAGSTPGVAKKMRNTKTLIVKRTKTAAAVRRSVNSSIQAAPRSRAFGSSALRTPSPSRLSATAVMAISTPGAMVTIGRV